MEIGLQKKKKRSKQQNVTRCELGNNLLFALALAVTRL